MKNKNLFISIKNNKINVEGGNKYEDETICIVSNDELYNMNQERINIEQIVNYYKDKSELANVISNTFTIIIIDKIKNKMFCIQDINGDSIPIYYYRNEEEILISNKLLKIIKYSDKKFTMNKKVVKVFLKRGFIPNKETLLKGIYKCIPNKNLVINLKNKKDKFVRKKICYTKINNYTEEFYIEEFERIINSNINNNIFTTLSNGYDSNFIYSFLDKNKSIQAFSIGGKSGRDETIQVAENIKPYPNTHLNVAYVDENTLEKYPEIIYRLEGAMYEIGIFLQYELAKLIEKQKGIENSILFAGEGADQIFHLDFHSKMFREYTNLKHFARYIKNKLKIILKTILRKTGFRRNILNLFSNDDYIKRLNAREFLTYVIIKKNGILMNDINIKCVYPYLYKNIIDIGYLNRKINRKDKQSHKQACIKKINKNLMEKIEKVGGATDLCALFKKSMYSRELGKYVKNNRYNILNCENNFFSKKYLLKVLYLDIFEYLFVECVDNIEEAKNINLSEFIEQKYFKKLLSDLKQAS